MDNSAKKNLNVAIVGAGIAGTTTAVALLESGFRNVTLIPKDNPLHTHSDIAPAIWRPFNGFPEDKFLSWCYASLPIFQKLAAIPESGVLLIPFLDLYPTEFHQTQKPGWMKNLPEVEIPDQFDYLKGLYPGMYATVLPLINTELYRPYLLNKIRRLGGKIELKEISNLSELANMHYQIIINCSGEQARFLVNDPSTFPIRGQVLQVTFTGTINPEETTIFAWSMGSDSPLHFIAARANTNDVIIGTTYQEHDDDLNPREEDTRQLLQYAKILWPAFESLLNNGSIQIEPKVGLRCGRDKIRIEAEQFQRSLIIHNYGHGGGYTASWGCAAEVVKFCCDYAITSMH